MGTAGRYFDYNATAPTRAEVVDAMAAAMRETLGNPSSMHVHGRRARQLIDEARQQVATLVGARPAEIVFTSGATESNNLAMRGFVAHVPGATIVTTTIEHHSVIATTDALERAGVPVQRLAVDADARPDLTRITELTAAGPCLVTVGWVNGESGHISDVAALAGAVAPGSLLHMDAAQAVGRMPVSVEPDVSLLSMSAHKFGGPWGIGALVVRTDLVDPQLTGGPQEGALRAGTENVASIVGMGAAAELAGRELADEGARLTAMRESLWSSLTASVPGLLRITPADGAPATLTIAVAELGSDVLVAGLDLAGFSVSAGSACAAGAPEPSHVMRGLGIDERYTRGVVRISLGHATTERDCADLATAFTAVVERARKAA